MSIQNCRLVWPPLISFVIQACHNFFVKKPKIFENVKSERAGAKGQKSLTPRASTIISKISQI